MMWRNLIIVAGLAIAQPALAQQDDLAEALALPVASSLAGAQDAPRFAWVENAAGVRNVWTAEPGKPARQVTSYAEDGVLVYDVKLDAKGEHLAWVRGGDDEFPDAALPNAGSAASVPPQEVFLDGTRIGDGHSPAFDSEGKRLAYTHKGEIWLWDGTAHKLGAGFGEVTDLQWSPDGSRLLFTANHDDYSFVVLVDVATAKVRYIGAGLGFSVEPIFSPDGKQVAFVHYADPPAGTPLEAGAFWRISVANADTGKARNLWSAPCCGKGGRWYGTRSRNLYWTANGELIFPWEISGWVHPYAIKVPKEDASVEVMLGLEPRELTPGAFEVESYVPSADGRALIYAANAKTLDNRKLWSVPLSGGTPVPLTHDGGTDSFPTLGGSQVAFIATSVTQPAYAALASHASTALHAAPGLKHAVTPETVTFAAEDGVTVHAQLFRATGSGKHPALIFVHGGPRRQMLPGFHPMNYYSNAYVLNQHFAAEGYDVLSVNYRSGTGYGLAFREAPGQARDGASEYRDVIAAGRWLAARSSVDPTRIGIWGGSWGGYLTALALARNSDVFAAGVDFHGVHTLLRGVPNNLSPDAQLAARQLQWSSSPMASMATWRSPVLLIHGDDDKNVDFAQSLLLARELAVRSIPYEELVFPNERHEFLRYADWLEAYRAADAFLRQHVMIGNEM